MDDDGNLSMADKEDLVISNRIKALMGSEEGKILEDTIVELIDSFQSRMAASHDPVEMHRLAGACTFGRSLLQALGQKAAYGDLIRKRREERMQYLRKRQESFPEFTKDAIG